MPNWPICVDASVVVALVTPESQSERALTLWTTWMSRETQVVAPGLLRYELASALWRKAVRGLMQMEDARRALEVALSLDITFLDPPELPLKAFDLASRLNRPTTYDMCYLALTEIVGGEFWTADERLYNAVREAFPAIRWLGAIR
ncbi:type II toxin-antitoxin system VapC family toxin [Thermoflexus sp.]|jgi:predicted nucleic acid-binding protein|uniref:type II toxin-antitoxin system VapC family toxin n=1 Tax=Thermoflexus sp. TaxID=1969742 RepID=UPI002611BECB|nr:type II toxin-antitoxin system VapC family toxin [Thermoflexus sp.]